MNRILLEARELGNDGLATLRDGRARHICDVLRATVGDHVRVGIVDGPVGDARVMALSEGEVTLLCDCCDRQPEPWLDVVLALPRPKVLRRLIAPLASLGVRRLYLTNAQKVERQYFGSHVLDEAVLRELCMEGLVQSGATDMPQVRLVRRLRPFLEDELPDLFAGSRRLLLHPRSGIPLLEACTGPARDVCLALGPEGGWSDFEIGLFTDVCGFQHVHLGWRVLCSDVACIAAIGAVTAARSLHGMDAIDLTGEQE